MAQIVITEKFMQFEEGLKFKRAAGRKNNANEIVHEGSTYWVPKTHSRVVGSKANTFNPGSYIPPAATSLDDLLGGTPTFGGGDLKVGPPEPKPKTKASVLSLEDNEVLMSLFTGGALPESGVDHIIKMYPSDTWGEEHWDFIPEFDCNYVWNPDALEALILGHKIEDRVLLSGLPGTGKTTAHKQYAAIIGQPFYRINGKDGMEPASFLGSLGPDGKGGWEWRDGALPMCMVNSYYLCIDECFKIPPGIQMAMQSVWERGGSLVLDDKPGTLTEKLVHAGKKFMLVGTDNCKGTGDSYGMFSSTQMQDTSSLDRFGITFTMPYLPKGAEAVLLETLYPTLSPTDIRKMIQVAGLVRKAYAQEEIAVTLSPRGLGAICRMMEHRITLSRAFELAFKEKLADEAEKSAVDEFLLTVGI